MSVNQAKKINMRKNKKRGRAVHQKKILKVLPKNTQKLKIPTRSKRINVVNVKKMSK